MKRYIIKIRRTKSGANGSTQYGFSTKLKAVIFGAGYQAALQDCGKGDIYVSVWDAGRSEGCRTHTQLMDARQLEEIARNE